MASTIAHEDWAFLDPWFATLNGLVQIADPGRYDTPGAVVMGRDPETDWWLEIDWSKDLHLAYQYEIETKLKRIREALLITSVLASADNKLWLKKLQQLGGFVPAPFMDLTAHQLRPHYQFRIQNRHSLIMVDWDNTIQFLCGSEGLTKDFYRYLRRAMRLSHEVVRPRLQLHVSVPATPPTFEQGRPLRAFKENDVSFLVLLETTIQQIQATNNLPVERPHFVLDSLHLDMSDLIEHSEALALLERIVVRGVYIDTIYLPHKMAPGCDRGSPEWRENWVSFVRALCNHHPKNSRRPRVSIGRLVVGRMEVVPDEFVMLCSAMMRADNVKMLQIGENTDNIDENEDFFPPGVWEMITAMLLSHNSSQSLNSLAVCRVSISDEDAEGIFHMVAVVNPLFNYFASHVAPFNVDIGNTAAFGVRIPAGTTVSSRYGFEENDTYSIKTATDLEAIVLDSDGDKTHVFIDGRGFCTVLRKHLPRKRIRLSMNDVERYANEEDEPPVSAKLKTLEITSPRRDTTTRAHLPEILEFAGGLPLQSLKLQVPGTDEETIRSALTHCPNLQHLSVSDATLDSMDVFEDVFLSGVPLQSLELGPTNVPSSALEGFFDKCRSRDGEPPVFSKIERLRLSQRLENSALDALSQVARDANSNLQYLHYYASQLDQSSYREIGEATNGMPISEIREPLAVSSRWAFLQVLHRVEQRRPSLVLTDDLKSLICSLAATPYTRTVVCDERPPPQALEQGNPPVLG